MYFKKNRKIFAGPKNVTTFAVYYFTNTHKKKTNFKYYDQY